MLTVVLAAASASRLGLGTYQSTTNYGNSQPLPADVKPVVNQGLHALNIASASLNSLAPQLPAALQSTNAFMKDNTVKVGRIIGQVCDQILREANPTGRAFQYFTPESLKSTCDYIRKVSSDMIAGINNPAIYVGYIEKLNESIQKLNAAAPNFQYGSYKPKTSFATKTVAPPLVLEGSGFGNAPAAARSPRRRCGPPRGRPAAPCRRRPPRAARSCHASRAPACPATGLLTEHRRNP